MQEIQSPLSPEEKRRLADKLFTAIQKEYVVVGKTRVRAWHGWLLIGIAAGVAVGIILVANRSGEVEQGRADETGVEVGTARPRISYSVLPYSKAQSGEVWTHIFEDPASGTSPTVFVLTFGPAAIYKYSDTWNIDSEFNHDPVLFQVPNSDILYVAYNKNGQVMRIRNGAEEPLTATLNQHHEPSIVMRSEADGRFIHGIKKGLMLEPLGEVFRLDGSAVMTKLADLKCAGLNASIAVLENGAFGYACYRSAAYPNKFLFFREDPSDPNKRSVVDISGEDPARGIDASKPRDFFMDTGSGKPYANLGVMDPRPGLASAGNGIHVAEYTVRKNFGFRDINWHFGIQLAYSSDDGNTWMKVPLCGAPKRDCFAGGIVRDRATGKFVVSWAERMSDFSLSHTIFVSSFRPEDLGPGLSTIIKNNRVAVKENISWSGIGMHFLNQIWFHASAYNDFGAVGYIVGRTESADPSAVPLSQQAVIELAIFKL